jgi:hypothetical protein
MRRRQNRAEHDVVAPRNEWNELPCAGQCCGKARNRNVLDEYAEQALVEPVREIELLQAPVGIKPCLRDEEEHRLAPLRRLVELALPTLAGGDAALRIEVEKNVVKTLHDEPIGKRSRFSVVLAGMAEEYAGHVAKPPRQRELDDTEGYASFGNGSNVAGASSQFGKWSGEGHRRIKVPVARVARSPLQSGHYTSVHISYVYSSGFPSQKRRNLRRRRGGERIVRRTLERASENSFLIPTSQKGHRTANFERGINQEKRITRNRRENRVKAHFLTLEKEGRAYMRRALASDSIKRGEGGRRRRRGKAAKPNDKINLPRCNDHKPSQRTYALCVHI